MYKIKLESHPNNELRVTLYPVVKKRERVEEDKSTSSTSPSPELLESPGRFSEKEKSLLLLDIRSDFRTVCSAMSHKRTEFGRFAKTRIMRAAGAMDRNDPIPAHYLFFTATLPGNTEWAKWAIASESSWIIDRFKSWLSKRVKSRYEFYVWEHQKRGALHFHYCIHVPDTATRQQLMSEFRTEWMRLLDGIAERSSTNVWGEHGQKTYEEKYAILQTTVQEVRKSVAAYMAGYCGSEKDKHFHDSSIPYYPKRWFGISRHLSSLIKENTETDEINYPNYRIAKMSFDEFNKEFEQEEIKGKIFCHTVGRGETGVHYHPPETQSLLWQARKTMQYQKTNFPNVSSMINLAYRVLLTCSELARGSQLYRKSASPLSRAVLEDSLYRDALRRGVFSSEVAMAIERLFLDLGSISSLPLTLENLQKDVKQFSQLMSQNYLHLRWNKYGYLNVTEDFPSTVDIREELSESRTRCDGEGEAESPDSYVSHVDCEPKESDQSEQMRLM